MGFGKRVNTHLTRLTLLCLGGVLGLSIGIALFFQKEISKPITVEEILNTLETQAVLVDRNGYVLYEALPKSGLRFEKFTQYSQAPDFLINAFIAAEDERFFKHHGLDFHGILRASYQNLKARKIVQGGSTLSQQTAKLIWPRPRTFKGKLLELRDALRLERHLSKEEILLLYFNLAPFGNCVQGVALASKHYFSKDLVSLSVGEAAYLASIPLNPTRLNPLKNPTLTHKRQERILSRMKKLGLIDETTYSSAHHEPITPTKYLFENPAPHFTEFLKQHCAHQFSSGGTLRTTLDLPLQNKVQALLSEQVARLHYKNVTSGSCIVIDNLTGEVLAWVGSPNSSLIQNDGIDNLRQPGSSIKPFTYLLGLDAGFTAATILPDVKQTFSAQEGFYLPENYSREYHGPVRMREALANSYNVAAVALLQELGPLRLWTLFHDLELGPLTQTDKYYGLGLTLGNAEVKLWQLANAYRMLANQGTYSELHFFKEAVSSPQKSLFRPEEVELLKDILADDRARASSFGREGALNPGFPVAAKTGTSQDFKDNFALGFNDQVTVGVWVGNPNRSSMRGVSGVSGAGPIFSAVFQTIAKTRAFTFTRHPEFFDRLKVCSLSGELPGPYCPHVIEELFIKSSQASNSTSEALSCSWHSKNRLTLPVAYASWLASTSQVHLTQASEPRLWIRKPQQGDHFLVDPRLSRQSQAIAVQVESPNKNQTLKFILNGEIISEESYPYKKYLTLSSGAYELCVQDTSGEHSSTVSFSVE